MSLFNKNNDKDAVSLWKKEAKRLEKERNQLYSELESIRNYKENYDSLIEEVTALKCKYEKAIRKVETIGNEYSGRLKKIAGKK